MPSKTSSAIRHFRKDDIAPVADLYRRVFMTQAREPLALLQPTLEQYFYEVFFEGPWKDDYLKSLVCVDAQDRITGFVGVVPRRMLFRERPILLANSFHFMADPDRPTLAGVQLLKALLSGPQDVTFTDHGGDLGRKLWDGLGGTTALAQSFNWVRLLRPAAYANRLVQARGAKFALAGQVARPICAAADWLLPRVLPSWLGTSSDLRETELDEATLSKAVEHFTSSYTLRPDTDNKSLHWLLQRAARFPQLGRLQKVALLDEQAKLVGSFVYYLNTTTTSRVLHLAAQPDLFELVLQHLFNHAAQRGALALSGRLDPCWMRAMTNQLCRFDGAGGWTMVHSHNAEIIQAINRGEAWLSRLEGEGCLLFQD